MLRASYREARRNIPRTSMKPLTIILPLVIAAMLTGCSSSSPNTSVAPDSAPIVSAGRTATPHATATPGNFDYFLLNLSWSPEYCQSHAGAAECTAHDTFVMHGLWPENTDGTYPEACSNAPGPANPSQYGDLYPEPGLLEHEWQQHGTCSGLSADAYFQAARTAYDSVKIPKQLSGLTTQTSMPPNQIVSLFTAANPQIPSASLAVSCGNNYLTAVEVCLDKQLHPIACGTLRSCKANMVRIPPPQ